MTPEEFERHYDYVVEQEKSTLCKKRTEYADGESRFSNFEEGSHLTGLTPEQTLWCYMAKHLVSVRDVVNGKKVSKELLREKIGDVRNYLVLLEGMILDKQSEHLDRLQDGITNISKEVLCQYEVNP